MMVISCHSNHVVSQVIVYFTPRGVNKGQLTSTSGTSAAHLGDGCRGYRPRAPCASIMGGMCSETWQWGLQPGGSLVGAAVP